MVSTQIMPAAPVPAPRRVAQRPVRREFVLPAVVDRDLASAAPVRCEVLRAEGKRKATSLTSMAGAK